MFLLDVGDNEILASMKVRTVGDQEHVITAVTTDWNNCLIVTLGTPLRVTGQNLILDVITSSGTAVFRSTKNASGREYVACNFDGTPEAVVVGATVDAAITYEDSENEVQQYDLSELTQIVHVDAGVCVLRQPYVVRSGDDDDEPVFPDTGVLRRTFTASSLTKKLAAGSYVVEWGDADQTTSLIEVASLGTSYQTNDFLRYDVELTVLPIVTVVRDDIIVSTGTVNVEGSRYMNSTVVRSLTPPADQTSAQDQQVARGTLVSGKGIPINTVVGYVDDYFMDQGGFVFLRPPLGERIESTERRLINFNFNRVTLLAMVGTVSATYDPGDWWSWRTHRLSQAALGFPEKAVAGVMVQSFDASTQTLRLNRSDHDASTGYGVDMRRCASHRDVPAALRTPITLRREGTTAAFGLQASTWSVEPSLAPGMYTLGVHVEGKAVTLRVPSVGAEITELVLFDENEHPVEIRGSPLAHVQDTTLTATQTTISVDDARALSQGDRIFIGEEQMTIDGVGNTTIQLARDAETAATHTAPTAMRLVVGKLHVDAAAGASDIRVVDFVGAVGDIIWIGGSQRLTVTDTTETDDEEVIIVQLETPLQSAYDANTLLGSDALSVSIVSEVNVAAKSVTVTRAVLPAGARVLLGSTEAATIETSVTTLTVTRGTGDTEAETHNQGDAILQRPLLRTFKSVAHFLGSIPVRFVPAARVGTVIEQVYPGHVRRISRVVYRHVHRDATSGDHYHSALDMSAVGGETIRTTCPAGATLRLTPFEVAKKEISNVPDGTYIMTHRLTLDEKVTTPIRVPFDLGDEEIIHLEPAPGATLDWCQGALLDEAMDTEQTHLVIFDASLLHADDVVRIGDEFIKLGPRTDRGFFRCVRGMHDSTPSAHGRGDRISCFSTPRVGTGCPDVVSPATDRVSMNIERKFQTQVHATEDMTEIAGARREIVTDDQFLQTRPERFPLLTSSLKWVENQQISDSEMQTFSDVRTLIVSSPVTSFVPGKSNINDGTRRGWVVGCRVASQRPNVVVSHDTENRQVKLSGPITCTPELPLNVLNTADATWGQTSLKVDLIDPADMLRRRGHGARFAVQYTGDIKQVPFRSDVFIRVQVTGDGLQLGRDGFSVISVHMKDSAGGADSFPMDPDDVLVECRDPGNGFMQGDVLSLRVLDVDTSGVDRESSSTTTLTANVTSDATTLSVAAAGSLTAPVILWINGEIMTVTAISGTTLTVERELDFEHASGDGVYLLNTYSGHAENVHIVEYDDGESASFLVAGTMVTFGTEVDVLFAELPQTTTPTNISIYGHAEEDSFLAEDTNSTDVKIGTVLSDGDRRIAITDVETSVDVVKLNVNPADATAANGMRVKKVILPAPAFQCKASIPGNSHYIIVDADQRVEPGMLVSGPRIHPFTRVTNVRECKGQWFFIGDEDEANGFSLLAWLLTEAFKFATAVVIMTQHVPIVGAIGKSVLYADLANQLLADLGFFTPEDLIPLGVGALLLVSTMNKHNALVNASNVSTADPVGQATAIANDLPLPGSASRHVTSASIGSQGRDHNLNNLYSTQGFGNKIFRFMHPHAWGSFALRSRPTYERVKSVAKHFASKGDTGVILDVQFSNPRRIRVKTRTTLSWNETYMSAFLGCAVLLSSILADAYYEFMKISAETSAQALKKFKRLQLMKIALSAMMTSVLAVQHDINIARRFRNTSPAGSTEKSNLAAWDFIHDNGFRTRILNIMEVEGRQDQYDIILDNTPGDIFSWKSRACVIQSSARDLMEFLLQYMSPFLGDAQHQHQLCTAFVRADSRRIFVTPPVEFRMTNGIPWFLSWFRPIQVEHKNQLRDEHPLIRYGSCVSDPYPLTENKLLVELSKPPGTGFPDGSNEDEPAFNAHWEIGRVSTNYASKGFDEVLTFEYGIEAEAWTTSSNIDLFVESSIIYKHAEVGKPIYVLDALNNGYKATIQTVDRTTKFVKFYTNENVEDTQKLVTTSELLRVRDAYTAQHLTRPFTLRRRKMLRLNAIGAYIETSDETQILDPRAHVCFEAPPKETSFVYSRLGITGEVTSIPDKGGYVTTYIRYAPGNDEHIVRVNGFISIKERVTAQFKLDVSETNLFFDVKRGLFSSDRYNDRETLLIHSSFMGGYAIIGIKNVDVSFFKTRYEFDFKQPVLSSATPNVLPNGVEFTDGLSFDVIIFKNDEYLNKDGDRMQRAFVNLAGPFIPLSRQMDSTFQSDLYIQHDTAPFPDTGQRPWLQTRVGDNTGSNLPSISLEDMKVEKEYRFFLTGSEKRREVDFEKSIRQGMVRYYTHMRFSVDTYLEAEALRFHMNGSRVEGTLTAAMTLAEDASNVDGFYTNMEISFGEEGSRTGPYTITSYTGATRVFSITPPTDSTTKYNIVRREEGTLAAPMTLATSADDQDDFYKDMLISFGEEDSIVGPYPITSYTGATRVFSLGDDVTVTTNNATKYTIIFSREGTLAAPMTLETNASNVDDFYKDMEISFGEGASRIGPYPIASYTGATRVFSITPITNNTTKYLIAWPIVTASSPTQWKLRDGSGSGTTENEEPGDMIVASERAGPALEHCIQTGTMQGSLTLAESSSNVDGYYVGMMIVVTGGTGLNTTSYISAYDGATRTVVADGLTTTDSTTEYDIWQSLPARSGTLLPAGTTPLYRGTMTTPNILDEVASTHENLVGMNIRIVGKDQMHRITSYNSTTREVSAGLSDQDVGDYEIYAGRSLVGRTRTRAALVDHVQSFRTRDTTRESADLDATVPFHVRHPTLRTQVSARLANKQNPSAEYISLNIRDVTDAPALFHPTATALQVTRGDNAGAHPAGTPVLKTIGNLIASVNAEDDKLQLETSAITVDDELLVGDESVRVTIIEDGSITVARVNPEAHSIGASVRQIIARLTVAVNDTDSVLHVDTSTEETHVSVGGETMTVSGTSSENRTTGDGAEILTLATTQPQTSHGYVARVTPAMTLATVIFSGAQAPPHYIRRSDDAWMCNESRVRMLLSEPSDAISIYSTTAKHETIRFDRRTVASLMTYDDKVWMEQYKYDTSQSEWMRRERLQLPPGASAVSPHTYYANGNVHFASSHTAIVRAVNSAHASGAEVIQTVAELAAPVTTGSQKAVVTSSRGLHIGDTYDMGVHQVMVNDILDTTITLIRGDPATKTVESQQLHQHIGYLMNSVTATDTKIDIDTDEFLTHSYQLGEDSHIPGTYHANIRQVELEETIPGNSAVMALLTTTRFIFESGEVNLYVESTDRMAVGKKLVVGTEELNIVQVNTSLRYVQVQPTTGDYTYSSGSDVYLRLGKITAALENGATTMMMDTLVEMRNQSHVYVGTSKKEVYVNFTFCRISSFQLGDESMTISHPTDTYHANIRQVELGQTIPESSAVVALLTTTRSYFSTEDIYLDVASTDRMAEGERLVVGNEELTIVEVDTLRRRVRVTGKNDESNYNRGSPVYLRLGEITTALQNNATTMTMNTLVGMRNQSTVYVGTGKKEVYVNFTFCRVSVARENPVAHAVGTIMHRDLTRLEIDLLPEVDELVVTSKSDIVDGMLLYPVSQLSTELMRVTDNDVSTAIIVSRSAPVFHVDESLVLWIGNESNTTRRLFGDVSVTQTHLRLTNSAGISAGDTLQIGDEQMQVLQVAPVVEVERSISISHKYGGQLQLHIGHLTSSIAADANTMSVTLEAGRSFTVPMRIRVGNEMMDVTAVTGTTLTVDRASPVNHSQGDIVFGVATVSSFMDASSGDVEMSDSSWLVEGAAVHINQERARVEQISGHTAVRFAAPVSQVHASLMQEASKLAVEASSVDDFYVGMNITVGDDLPYRIVTYDGATKAIGVDIDTTSTTKYEISFPVEHKVSEGTMTATRTLAEGSNDADDHYVGMYIKIGSSSSRYRITDYNGSARTVQASGLGTTNNTTTYEIFAPHIVSEGTMTDTLTLKIGSSGEDNYYQGMDIAIGDSDTRYRVTSYSGTTRVIEAIGIAATTNATTYKIFVPADYSGTMTAPLTLAAGASNKDNYYVGLDLVINGARHRITAYNGSTRVVVAGDNVGDTDNTTDYMISFPLIASGTMTAPMTLANNASSTDDDYKEMSLTIGEGDSRSGPYSIVSYTGATRRVTVSIPNTTDTTPYVISRDVEILEAGTPLKARTTLAQPMSATDTTFTASDSNLSSSFPATVGGIETVMVGAYGSNNVYAIERNQAFMHPVNTSVQSVSALTTLDADVSVSATSLSVVSASSLAAPVRIMINDEEMTVTEISGTTLTVVRADPASAHTSGAGVHIVANLARALNTVSTHMYASSYVAAALYRIGNETVRATRSVVPISMSSAPTSSGCFESVNVLIEGSNSHVIDTTTYAPTFNAISLGASPAWSQTIEDSSRFIMDIAYVNGNQHTFKRRVLESDGSPIWNAEFNISDAATPLRMSASIRDLAYEDTSGHVRVVSLRRDSMGVYHGRNSLDNTDALSGVVSESVDNTVLIVATELNGTATQSVIVSQLNDNTGEIKNTSLRPIFQGEHSEDANRSETINREIRIVPRRVEISSGVSVQDDVQRLVLRFPLLAGQTNVSEFFLGLAAGQYTVHHVAFSSPPVLTVRTNGVAELSDGPGETIRSSETLELRRQEAVVGDKIFDGVGGAEYPVDITNRVNGDDVRLQTTAEFTDVTMDANATSTEKDVIVTLELIGSDKDKYTLG